MANIHPFAWPRSTGAQTHEPLVTALIAKDMYILLFVMEIDESNTHIFNSGPKG